ncbi:hypothetical protein DFH08DRAFT_866007 [Mycena albidolilacea]|uniref:DUF6534 domain-containing protein n=1 Tax=Mycena albidolilacea TaxID=1033008 RepID=A0AAD7A3V2_9AGAR|nr:hypothetical protein DFH08DRAFT_866007 [Mycena albidolilacea]
MPSATLQPGAPLDNTMGALYLGVVGSAILYGISLLQTVLYFTRYRRDPVYLKALVFVTLILETLHMILIMHAVYYYLITNYYKTSELQVVVWSVAIEAVPTGLTAALVQSFYAFRVYRISAKDVRLTGVILLLVGATSACGTAWVILALSKYPSYDRLRTISPLAISINALSTSADVVITATLCYMLHKSRAQSLADESFLSRLILFTINTGLMTSLCAVAALISIVFSPNTLIYASFYFCVGRLYTNALLASLNARSVIRGHIRDVDSNFHNHNNGNSNNNSYPTIGRSGVLTAPVDIVAATELADLEAEFYENGGGYSGKRKGGRGQLASDERSSAFGES